MMPSQKIDSLYFVSIQIFYQNMTEMETKIEIEDLSPFRNYEVSLTQKPFDDVNDKYWSNPIQSNFKTSFEGKEKL